IIEISSASHPFYTGEDRTLDKTGRVEKFKQRAAAAKRA
ncbi:MAG: 50S ribosomal protein L31, partial [Patescibacteria group bacterium]